MNTKTSLEQECLPHRFNNRCPNDLLVRLWRTAPSESERQLAEVRLSTIRNNCDVCPHTGIITTLRAKHRNDPFWPRVYTGTPWRIEDLTQK